MATIPHYVDQTDEISILIPGRQADVHCGPYNFRALVEFVTDAVAYYIRHGVRLAAITGSVNGTTFHMAFVTPTAVQLKLGGLDRGALGWQHALAQLVTFSDQPTEVP